MKISGKADPFGAFATTARNFRAISREYAEGKESEREYFIYGMFYI